MSRRALVGPASLVAIAFALIVVAGSMPAGCAGEVPCEFNSDCVIGYCVDGTCQQDCVDAARDCPASYICNDNAQCVPSTSSSSSTSGAGAGGGASSTTTSHSGGTGGTTSTSNSTTSSETGGAGGATTTTTTSSSSTTGNPTGKHELDLCASDADCASPLVCRAKVAGTGGAAKRCTRQCGSNGQCMTGTRCELFGAEHYCAQSDTGRTCTTASNPCNFACLNDQYCTSECGDGHDCPNGYGCMDVQSFRICIKAEAPCSSGDASLCIAPDACDESLYVGGCTLACNTAADCPQRASVLSPWSCDGGGICRRPGDVFGPQQGGSTPAQYVNDCQGNVVNVCNDGFDIDFGAFSFPSPPSAQCNDPMTTPGSPTDSCLNSCRYQGGCSFGFACTGVGNLGNTRIGLCLPTGSGEVKNACAHDSQCLYGYCNAGKCSRDCTKDGICPSGSSCVAGGAPTVDGLAFKRCQ